MWERCPLHLPVWLRKRLAGETQTVETTAGIVTGRRIDQRLYRIRLNDPTTVRLDSPVEADGVTYVCSYVELGNPGIPHAVVPYAGLRQADENELRELGRAIRWNKVFPKGANVNFYEITGEDLIFERTFERGVEDFTYACGTGTGSVVTVLTLQGKVSGHGVQVDNDRRPLGDRRGAGPLPYRQPLSDRPHQRGVPG